MKICAPFAGIVRYHVSTGQRVSTSEAIATVEAVKLEAPVYSSCFGVVGKLALEDFSDCVGGDVLAEIEEA